MMPTTGLAGAVRLAAVLATWLLLSCATVFGAWLTLLAFASLR